MSWLGVITDAGREVYNQYSMSGVELNISSLKLGSGPVDSSHMRDKTALVNEETSGVIESINTFENGTQLMLRAGASPSAVGAYTLKEMGVYVTVTVGGADTEVLFAYCIETGDGIGIPSEDNFPDFVYILTTNLIVDNTAEMTVTVPPSSFVSYLQFSAAISGLETSIANKKTVQTAVADPTASGNAFSFIDTISQNTNGVITPTKKTIPVMTGATSGSAGEKGLTPAPGAGKHNAFLRGDGEWAIPNDTTYNTMTGATSTTAGTGGLTPAPGAGDQEAFLRGDGTWAIPSDTKYSAGAGLSLNGTTFSLATTGVTAGSFGPSADVTGNNDATIKVPYFTVDDYGRLSAAGHKTLTLKNTTYSNMTGATSSAAGKAGLVPAPGAGKNTSFLRGDGSWVIPTNTTYSAGTGLSLNGTTFSLATSGVSAGSYGPTGDVSGTNNSTIKVPYITVDAYGRVTSITNKTLTNKDTTYGVATTSANGLMSASDKSKLNGIQAGAKPDSDVYFNNAYLSRFDVKFKDLGTQSGIGTEQSINFDTAFNAACIGVVLIVNSNPGSYVQHSVYSWTKTGFKMKINTGGGANVKVCYLAFGY